MLDRSVAARRFVIQTLDRLLAQSATGGQASSAAPGRGQDPSGSPSSQSGDVTGSRN